MYFISAAAKHTANTFFFFQAEDGIRDRNVTGVQTCALPISHEHEIAHIDGAVLMPLGELPDRLGELDGHREIVTHCHHGARSLKALEILKAACRERV